MDLLIVGFVAGYVSCGLAVLFGAFVVLLNRIDEPDAF
jgi:hypothetical protein